MKFRNIVVYAALSLAMVPFRTVAEETYDGYLFTYFTGNDKRDEAIRFALSRDGLTFTALNDNAPDRKSTRLNSSHR